MTNNLRHITNLPGVDIYEQKPGFRTIQTLAYGNFYLYLPYVVFILKEDCLRVGFRVQPLDETNLKEEILLQPPLSNIYHNSFVVCCEPSINEFWFSRFLGHGWRGHGWRGDSLLESDLTSYRHWSTLNPEEVMKIFEKWPPYAQKTIVECLNYVVAED